MGKKKSLKKPTKSLPGFRGESELPEHGVDETTGTPNTTAGVETFDIAATHSAVDNVAPTPGDPTDLTLEREKQFEPTDDSRPFAQPPKKKGASKKQLIVLLSLLAVVAVAAAGWFVYQKRAEDQQKQGETDIVATTQEEKVEQPKTVPAPLTGLEVSEADAARQVVAVMIENSPDARPQSGLDQADMVFEAVAEGGITRFVALFQQGKPSQIGPIRSARPYYVQIARTFDSAYVHAGGSDDGLAKVTQLGVKDMSAFEENGTYTRLSSRAAPHNLYSSIDKLFARAAALGYTSSSFTPWEHKEDTPQTPTAGSVKFSLSGVLYDPTFTYDAATNSYTRSVAGEPQVDAVTGAAISPKVVIALATTKGQQGQYSTYRLTGTGEIRVLQDGIMSTGTWSKDSDEGQFVFKDKNGLPFKFNKGSVWVTLVGSTGNVSVQ